MNVTLALASVLALLGCAEQDAPPTPPYAGPISATPASSASAVVLQRLSVTDAPGAPIEVGVWAPTDFAPDRTYRLIVISHGTGSDFRGHEDTARALASAGFVVASLTHTGDNWRDSSRSADLPQRPRQLSRLIDFMLTEWESHSTLDPEDVGAFGFSAGAFTVLAAAGAEPDLSRFADHCRTNPSFFDCRLVAANAGAAYMTETPHWVHDARIKAVVAAAPALGFAFGERGLAGVRQPVQLWTATQDDIVPSAQYAEPVRDALPARPDYRVVEGAGHFDFLPPCSERLAAAAPQICMATPGFDRAAFHDTFNKEIVSFFESKL